MTASFRSKFGIGKEREKAKLGCLGGLFCSCF